MNGRYLIELVFPSVQIYYNEKCLKKNLVETDISYMMDNDFRDWKRYIMNQHFRLELNIGKNEPLPRISEDKHGEDEVFSEGDPRERYPPSNQEEKQKIEVTRNKLS